MTDAMFASTAAEEFETLASPHLAAIRRFARYLTRSTADADDLVQETSVRALRGWHTFRPDSDLRAWLFRICRNTFLRMRRTRRREIAFEDGDPEVTSAIARQTRAAHAEGDSMFDRVDVRPAIERAIGDLREPYRTALRLVDLEDRTYEEVAAMLGVTTGAVKTRVHRARRLVQGALHAYATDAGLRTRRARQRHDWSTVQLPRRCA